MLCTSHVHFQCFLFLCVAGHLMGPVLCHSFCNYMGFPAISTALEHPHRITVLSSYLLGVLLFLLFLFPFTDPSYYGLPTPVCTLTSSPSSLCLSWFLPTSTPLLLLCHLPPIKWLRVFFATLEFRSGPVRTHSTNSHVGQVAMERLGNL